MSTRCEERSKPDAEDPLNLEDCADLLKMIQDNYYEEYRMYELWVLAVALVFPLVSDARVTLHFGIVIKW